MKLPFKLTPLPNAAVSPLVRGTLAKWGSARFAHPASASVGVNAAPLRMERPRGGKGPHNQGKA